LAQALSMWHSTMSRPVSIVRSAASASCLLA